MGIFWGILIFAGIGTAIYCYIERRHDHSWIIVDDFDGHCDNLLDEAYSKAAACGDRLAYLSKTKRQEIRGVDMYKCNKCGKSGAPWSWHGTDLDKIVSDEIHGVCPCGGVILLIDD